MIKRKRNRNPRSNTHGFKLQATYKEIAAEMHITPQRVQQIERRAMRKLAKLFLAMSYGQEK